jgi:hypothetical protein
MITLWVRRHKHGAAVSCGERFKALADAADDVVAW